MTDEQTITEDALIELLAGYEPNTLECEDAMWAFVNAADRHATYEAKALKMATLIAETAERRRMARQTVLSYSSGGPDHG